MGPEDVILSLQGFTVGPDRKQVEFIPQHHTPLLEDLIRYFPSVYF